MANHRLSTLKHYDNSSNAFSQSQSKKTKHGKRRIAVPVEVNIYDTIKACSARAESLLDLYGQEDDKWITNNDTISLLNDSSFLLRLDNRDLQDLHDCFQRMSFEEEIFNDDAERIGLLENPHNVITEAISLREKDKQKIHRIYNKFREYQSYQEAELANKLKHIRETKGTETLADRRVERELQVSRLNREICQKREFLRLISSIRPDDNVNLSDIIRTTLEKNAQDDVQVLTEIANKQQEQILSLINQRKEIATKMSNIREAVTTELKKKDVPSYNDITPDMIMDLNRDILMVCESSLKTELDIMKAMASTTQLMEVILVFDLKVAGFTSQTEEVTSTSNEHLEIESLKMNIESLKSKIEEQIILQQQLEIDIAEAEANTSRTPSASPSAGVSSILNIGRTTLLSPKTPERPLPTTEEWASSSVSDDVALRKSPDVTNPIEVPQGGDNADSIVVVESTLSNSAEQLQNGSDQSPSEVEKFKPSSAASNASKIEKNDRNDDFLIKVTSFTEEDEVVTLPELTCQFQKMIETIMDSSIDTPLLPTPTNVKGIRVKDPNATPDKRNKKNIKHSLSTKRMSVIDVAPKFSDDSLRKINGFGIDCALQYVNSLILTLVIDAEDCLPDSDNENSDDDNSAYVNAVEEDESPPDTDDEDNKSTTSYQLGFTPYKTRALLIEAITRRREKITKLKRIASKLKRTNARLSKKYEERMELQNKSLLTLVRLIKGNARKKPTLFNSEILLGGVRETMVKLQKVENIWKRKITQLVKHPKTAIEAAIMTQSRLSLAVPSILDDIEEVSQNTQSVTESTSTLEPSSSRVLSSRAASDMDSNLDTNFQSLFSDVTIDDVADVVVATIDDEIEGDRVRTGKSQRLRTGEGIQNEGDNDLDDLDGDDSQGLIDFDDNISFNSKEVELNRTEMSYLEVNSAIQENLLKNSREQTPLEAARARSSHAPRTIELGSDIDIVIPKHKKLTSIGKTMIKDGFSHLLLSIQSDSDLSESSHGGGGFMSRTSSHKMRVIQRLIKNTPNQMKIQELYSDTGETLQDFVSKHLSAIEEKPSSPIKVTPPILYTYTKNLTNESGNNLSEFGAVLYGSSIGKTGNSLNRSDNVNENNTSEDLSIHHNAPILVEPYFVKPTISDIFRSKRNKKGMSELSLTAKDMLPLAAPPPDNMKIFGETIVESKMPLHSHRDILISIVPNSKHAFSDDDDNVSTEITSNENTYDKVFTKTVQRKEKINRNVKFANERHVAVNTIQFEPKFPDTSFPLEVKGAPRQQNNIPNHTELQRRITESNSNSTISVFPMSLSQSSLGDISSSISLFKDSALDSKSLKSAMGRDIFVLNDEQQQQRGRKYYAHQMANKKVMHPFEVDVDNMLHCIPESQPRSNELQSCALRKSPSPQRSKLLHKSPRRKHVGGIFMRSCSGSSLKKQNYKEGSYSATLTQNASIASEETVDLSEVHDYRTLVRSHGMLTYDAKVAAEIKARLAAMKRITPAILSGKSTWDRIIGMTVETVKSHINSLWRTNSDTALDTSNHYNAVNSISNVVEKPTLSELGNSSFTINEAEQAERDIFTPNTSLLKVTAPKTPPPSFSVRNRNKYKIKASDRPQK